MLHNKGIQNIWFSWSTEWKDFKRQEAMLEREAPGRVTHSLLSINETLVPGITTALSMMTYVKGYLYCILY